MAGFTVNEGRSYLANVLYKDAANETYTLGLFTNAPATLTTSSAWAAVTQPAGSGYAEITLVAGTFTVDANGTVTYPQQQWTAGDTWTGGDVQGYYVRHNNASPVLVHVQYRDEGGYTMNNGKEYIVDLDIDTS